MVSSAPLRARPGTLRLAALLGAAAVLWRLGGGGGQAYAVKGSWQGKPGSLRGVAKGDFDTALSGLEPNVSFPNVTYDRKGLALSATDDGHLVGAYTAQLDNSTSLKLKINEERTWQAELAGKDASLRVKGQGKDWDGLFWEARKESFVEDVGDVTVEFNSDSAYNLTVARPLLARVGGADLSATVRATNDGITGRFEARKVLPKEVEVEYSVENPVGVYELGNSTHTGRLAAPFAGGSLALKVEGDAEAQEYHGHYAHALEGGLAELQVFHEEGALGYNASYTRDLALGKKTQVDANVIVGFDKDGAYGRLAGSRPLGKGWGAEYEALARVEAKGEHEKKLMHAFRLTNGLGFAELFHGKGEAPRLRLGYEFDA